MVQALNHEMGRSCKEGPSNYFLGRASEEEVELGRNTVLAVDYEAHGHVDSLRTASVLIVSKRFAATT